MAGKLVLVVGPSGSGKGTLIKAAYKKFPSLVHPITCTTRAQRPGEVHGVDRLFISKEEFNKKIEEGVFLEWAEYGGNLYGTPYQSVVPSVSEGKVVIDELEVQGARQILDKLPKEQVATIFIDAGSWEEMEERIKARAAISEDELEKRKSRYADEMTFKSEADFVVSNKNGELETARSRFEEILEQFLQESTV